MKIRRRRLLLCIITIFLMFSFTVEAATKSEIQAGNQLHALNIFKGYEDGTLRLDRNITRAEMAALLVRVLGYENKIIINSKTYEYSDVKSENWAKEVIEKASQLELFKGYPDGTFKPDESIKYVEVVALMIRALDEEKNIQGTWPYNYIHRGIELGIITDEFNDLLPDTIITRGKVAVLLWNTLLVKK